MHARTISALLLLLLAMASGGCATSASRATKWNTAQISEIRKRAAFALSCDAEDLEIIQVARDSRGRVRTLRAVGCDRKATYVIEGATARSAPQWTLDVERLSAQN